MYAIRKTDMKAFTPDAQSVCRIMDGSTNAYLIEARAIEEFLKTIEPRYNSAAEKLISGQIDSASIYAIAGFAAYVVTCSPGGMRIQSGPLKTVLETTAIMADARGLFPTPPPELGSESLTELLQSGAIRLNVDPKYPQALGISAILKNLSAFGNSSWEILINDCDDSPFFTSDYPVAIEKTEDPRVLDRIVPLTPTLAIRIKLDITVNTNHPDLSFPNFRHRARNISRHEIIQLNGLIVRCAEETVFHRDDLPWVKPFVAKNRHYRIEPLAQRFEGSDGTILYFSQQLIKTSSFSKRESSV